MKYEFLNEFLSDSPAVAILRSPQAPLFLCFIYQLFKQKQQVSVPLVDLQEALTVYLEYYQPENAESAKSWIDKWADENHRFLRKYYPPKQDEPLVELTPDTEKVLFWLEEMSAREFVGTESRFKRIIDMLNELVEFSSSNREERLQSLRQQKYEIESEIERLESGGELTAFNETQMKERFYDVHNTARALLRDFREIEENFKNITKTLKEKAYKERLQKGEIVGFVLDAEDELKNKDQGRSFYAFWDFLTTSLYQDELKNLLDRLQNHPLFAHDDNLLFMRKLKANLLNAGEKVLSSNGLMLQELRRILDEGTWQDSMRIGELLQEIKHLSLTCVDRPPASREFLLLEKETDIHMPLERPLWRPQEKDIGTDGILEVGDTGGWENFEDMFNQFYIDRELLQSQINKCLRKVPAITLCNVLKQYPLTHGFPELLAYLSIGAEEGGHKVDSQKKELFYINEPNIFDNQKVKAVRMPSVTYRREERIDYD